MKKPLEILPIERIAHAIHFIRGHKVLLDSDLAILYGVTTKALNRAVKRHLGRFPGDFMFQLTPQELQNLRCQIGTSSAQDADLENNTNLRSQIVTSSLAHGGRRSRPYAFTEQGVAMLSSVLNSERAVQVNIAIMRTFIKLREALGTNRDLARKFAELETRVGGHDQQIAEIIEAIRQLIAPPSEESKKEIGFHVKETPPRYRVGKKR